jgi:hypothetical protein
VYRTRVYEERFFMHADRAVSTPGELEVWVRVMADRTKLDDTVLVKEGVTFTRMAIIEKPPANLRDPTCETQAPGVPGNREG